MSKQVRTRGRNVRARYMTDTIMAPNEKQMLLLTSATINDERMTAIPEMAKATFVIILASIIATAKIQSIHIHRKDMNTFHHHWGQEDA